MEYEFQRPQGCSPELLWLWEDEAVSVSAASGTGSAGTAAPFRCLEIRARSSVYDGKCGEQTTPVQKFKLE